ncbi:MAG: hypothetical protein KIC98_04775 [Clostridioides difficile]|nr:hypothetical protein [Clostridioides difficile]
MNKQIFIYDLQKVEDDIFLIRGINYQPHIFKPNVEGVFLNEEDFPILDESKLKINDAKLYYNQATNKAYYEYFERPKTEDDISKEKIIFLEKQVADLSFLVMQLQGGTN